MYFRRVTFDRRQINFKAKAETRGHILTSKIICCVDASFVGFIAIRWGKSIRSR